MILGAIVGATAVGKSHFAVSLAKRLNCEIISADSRQVYRGFRIGTGQIDDTEMAGVRHHLLDFLSADKQYNAKKFIDDVRVLVDKNPSTRYLVVGGTGLYVKSLIEGVSVAPPSDTMRRSRLECELKRDGIVPFHQRLKDIDPISFKLYHPNDTIRVTRALEVYEITGLAFSSFKESKEGGIGSIPMIWLSIEREALYERINFRVDSMFENGWLKEVQNLYSYYGTLDLPGFNSIGYRQIADSGPEIADLEVEMIKKETRNYAKRQLTFFRNQFEAHILDPFSEKALELGVELMANNNS
ncbi:MAG: tRNA (adenosine(37)-N6)-dimethylallyltransferase MiaA [Fibrobacterales bacterium]